MRTSLRAFALALALLLRFFPSTRAALQSATLSEAKGSVFRGNVKPPADETQVQVKAGISVQQYLKTGSSSLAELIFNDQTMARLGSNSVFRFSSDKTNLLLEKGEGLFVVPKGLGGATISTPSLSAAILGTTVYVKMDPRAVEYYCLEGKCRIGPHVLSPGESLILKGKMGVYGAPKSSFKIADFMKQNQLANAFKAPLPSKALIQAEAAKQP